MVSSFLKNLRLFLALMSFTTITLEPLAQAKMTENNIEATRRQLIESFNDAGLNKGLTFKQFVEENYVNFAPEIRERIKELSLEQPNLKMPQFNVVLKQNKMGEKVIFIETESTDHKLISFEYVGDKDVYVKYGQQKISIYDAISIETMSKKMVKAETKTTRVFPIKGKTTKFVKTKTQPVKHTVVENKFSLPTMTKEIWLKLKPRERAEYIVRLTTLDRAALQVLELAKKHGVKTSQNEVIEMQDVHDQLKSAWAFLLSGVMSEAQAAGETNDDDRFDVIEKDAKDCVIAGNISTYNGKNCTMPVKYLGITGQLMAKNIACSGNYVACNVNLYGSKADGKPYCISNNEAIRKASSVACMKKVEIQSDCIAKSGQDQISCFNKSTQLNLENYLKGLKATKNLLKQSSSLDILIGQDGKLKDVQANQLTENLLQELASVQTSFATHQDNASRVCASPKNQRNESEFKTACAAVASLKLSLADYIKTKFGCIDANGKRDDSLFDPTTFKCKCGTVAVNPGGTVTPSLPSSSRPLPPPASSRAPSSVTPEGSETLPPPPPPMNSGDSGQEAAKASQTLPSGSQTPSPKPPSASTTIPAPANGSYALPGQKCNANQVTPTEVKTGKPVCDEMNLKSEGVPNCICENTEKSPIENSDGTYTCDQRVYVVGKKVENKKCGSSFTNYTKDNANTMSDSYCECDNGQAPYAVCTQERSKPTYPNQEIEGVENKCAHGVSHYACSNFDWGKILAITALTGIGACMFKLGICKSKSKPVKACDVTKLKCDLTTQTVDTAKCSCVEKTIFYCNVNHTSSVYPPATCPVEGGSGTNDTDNGGLPDSSGVITVPTPTVPSGSSAQ